MCAAAHGWVGLGRIVSNAQVEGPVEMLAEELRQLDTEYYKDR